ncbi:hypothetical protein J437_LFUL004061 [Ladona fulva]|uniref:DNA damage-binding protein 2 n=1 Tax=Ladona fulva TaxID=123851 RepID=A0A8K0JVZ9_LADFU|nr:hypothetical protein J437_LFUL004061 [Ladona fulva]
MSCESLFLPYTFSTYVVSFCTLSVHLRKMPKQKAPPEKSSRQNLRKRKKSPQEDNNSDSDFENNSCNEQQRKTLKTKPKETKSKYFKKKLTGTTSLPLSKLSENQYTSHNLSGHRNIVNYLYNTNKCDVFTCYRETFQNVIVKDISNFHVHRANAAFSRRITSMTWHPTLSCVLAVASKGGDLLLWDIKDERNEFIPGSGPGGAVKALKFDVSNPTRVYTASIDGTVSLQDFLGKDSKVLSEIDNYREYFSALDVSPINNAIVSGDTKGNVMLLNLDGKFIWNSRLHKQKVTHIEFNSRESWVLATASLDHTVRIWDLRNIKGGSIETLNHEKPINSAYFSIMDGVRLLTTDQHSQLRIFRGPLWSLEKVVLHPHRQFQHLTNIKANWHPLEDIIVVGRYPDPAFKDPNVEDIRSIDFIDPGSGKMLHQLSQVGVSGIVSLNTFNRTGDFLASGMGLNALIWCNKSREEIQKRTRPKINKDTFPEKIKRPQRSSKKKEMELKK